MKNIKCFYSLTVICEREIDVDDSFEIRSTSAKNAFYEMNKKLPEARLDSLYDTEMNDIRSHETGRIEFNKIESIQVFDDEGNLIQELN